MIPLCEIESALRSIVESAICQDDTTEQVVTTIAKLVDEYDLTCHQAATLLRIASGEAAVQ